MRTIDLQLVICVAGFFYANKVYAKDSIILPLGDDPQAIIDSHPPGTDFELATGIHRGYEIILKDGDELTGQTGAVLSGAELLTGWRFEDPFWIHDGPHSKAVDFDDPKAHFWEWRATRPHDLFVDDIPLIQKYTPALVYDENSWAYDYEKDQVYVRFNPTKKKMELSGLCNFAIRTDAQRVVLRNIHCEKFATRGQNAAVTLGAHALIEQCSVSGSHATGIRVKAYSHVKNSRFFWNGLAGLHDGGRETIIEYCEFAYNGWAGFSGNWSRGGAKMPGAIGMVVRRNYAHHNTGPGFWFDINSRDCLFEENLSEYNSWEGLVFEISCNCEIRHNIIRWNGLIPRGVTSQDPVGGLLWGVPLVIQNGEGADVHHNYFEAAQIEGARGGGVTIINQNRPQHIDGVCGTHVPEQNHIHDNVIIMPRGGFNGLQYGRSGWDTYADFLAAGNLWERNTYFTGNPTSGNFHWYSQGDSESAFNTAFYNWEQWQFAGQDQESQFIGKHTSFFNKHNPELNDLIIATTGVSYAELKEPFINSDFDSITDEDEDQMPDQWEVMHGLSPIIFDSAEDNDEDGLPNLEEYTAGTDPLSYDTDKDGMPDGWELQNGLDPLEADPLGDPDADWLSNLEEFEAGTMAQVNDSLRGSVPDRGLTMWLKANAPLSMDSSGELTPWSDWRTAGVMEMGRPYNHSAPLFSEDSTNGYPMLFFGKGNLRTRGSLPFGDSASEGWTLTIALKPRPVMGSTTEYALAGNSIWRESGFRLTIKQGYLRFYSTQPEGRLFVHAIRRLQDDVPVVVTLIYDGINQVGRLYIDGEEQGRFEGRIPGNEMPLWIGHIGGMVNKPTDYAEVLTYSRALTHLERREVEAMLLGKYQSSGFAVTDSDGDGMSDWWEVEYGGIDDPEADPDNDGLTNIVEFRNRTNPHSKDTDGDALTDLWEVNNNWNPRRDDSVIDADHDGLSLVEEYERGTFPDNPDSDGDGMPDGWEDKHGIDPLIGDTQGDLDADGLSDLEEFEQGTNPRLADTDGDTLDDFWEVTNNWNPLVNNSVTDTDGDGVTDVKEVHYGTDFTLQDTDGDGVDDGEELALGADPNDPLSVPDLPPTFSERNFSISRTSMLNTVIGVFPVMDPNGDIIEYNIINNVDPDHDGNFAFRIAGNRLLVNDAGDLNHLIRDIPVAAGGYHSLVLRSDGSVTGWGRNEESQADVPVAMRSPIAIAAGFYHSLVLQEDGVVGGWGANDYAQAVTPENLTMVKAIAAGGYHTLALQADGRVIAWGRNNYGQSNVPSDLGSASAIAAGAWHSMALLESGQIVAWGINNWGQRSVPSGLNQVVSISAGALHSLALKADGRLVAWGQNMYQQRSVPANLGEVVAIAAGGYHNLALMENGTVEAWGRNNYGQTSVPEGLTGVIAIFAGGYHSIALKSDGTLVGWGRRGDGQLDIPEDLRLNQKLLHRAGLLQIKVQASDGKNFTNAIVTIDLLDDPDGDLDGDGLPYSQEILAGTDPLHADTDRDGMHDGWEVFHSLDPLNDESSGDDDFDGFNNIDELASGTNPVEWLDADNDGMHDKWELQFGLKVGTADGAEDNDGDLQSNFMEFIFGGNPQDRYSVYRLEARLENFEFPIIEFHRSRAVFSHYYKTYLEKLNAEDTWEPLPESALTRHYIGEGIEKVVLRPTFGEKGFYRVKVSPR